MDLNRRQIIVGTLATLFARSIPLHLPTYKHNDLYISQEAIEDIRKWGINQIDETTMREIFRSGVEIKKITTLELVEKPR